VLEEDEGQTFAALTSAHGEKTRKPRFAGNSSEKVTRMCIAIVLVAKRCVPFDGALVRISISPLLPLKILMKL
jgi:hypothetical protein